MHLANLTIEWILLYNTPKWRQLLVLLQYFFSNVSARIDVNGLQLEVVAILHPTLLPERLLQMIHYFWHILAIPQLVIPNLWRNAPLITVLRQTECFSFSLRLISYIVVVHNTSPLLELRKHLKRPWRLLERIQIIHDLGPRSY